MPAKKEKVRKGEIIPVRVTPKELEDIRTNAKSCSMPTSTYLRALGLNNKVHSKIDQQSVLKLLSISGDLGRLGGLLKLWLTNKERFNVTQITPNEVEQAFEDILKTRKELENAIREFRGYSTC